MKALFGDYLPDQPDHIAPGLITVSGVYPGSTGYRPAGQYVATTTALPLPCKGAASFVSPLGTSTIIAGTATDLYRLYSGAWQSIASGFSIQGDNRWRFVQFGGLAIATNEADAMDKIDLETSAVSLLGGSPPKFRMLGVVQNFLVGGVLNGDVNTLGWSGENDAEWWTFGQRKSDYNILPDGGAITGIISGEYGLILQRGAVRRMQYVGGNVLFRFDKISSNVGCVSVHSVAQFGEIAFWYSDDGFKMWDGATIIPIGFEKVDATFAAQYGVSNWPAMSTAVDGGKSVVAWAMSDKWWIYNWRLQKWSIVPITSQIVFAGFTKTLVLEEQDPDVGANDDILDFPGLVSFDDARFKGGDPRFYVFDSANTMGTLSGANMAASFGMRNVELIDGRDARVKRVRPMSDVVTNVTLTLNAKQRLGDAGTTTIFTALNNSGEMPVRARGRFIKATFAIAAGAAWTYAQGLDVKLTAGGGR